MKTTMRLGMAFLYCWIGLFAKDADAGETNDFELLRLSLSTNDVLLQAIRDEFYVLPRPLIARYWTRPLHIGFGLTSFKYEAELNADAKAFVRKYTWDRYSDLPVLVALYPVLDDPLYSGDAAIMLSSDISEVIPSGYVSPSDRGQWNSKGSSIRKFIRYTLRKFNWLDANGKPMVVPKDTFGPQKVTLEECADRNTNHLDASASPQSGSTVTNR